MGGMAATQGGIVHVPNKIQKEGDRFPFLPN